MRLGHVFGVSLALAVVGATACSSGVESSCGSFFDTTIARANKCNTLSLIDPSTKSNFEKYCGALATAPGANNLGGQIDSCNSKTQSADCNTSVNCKIVGTLADGAACGVSTQCAGGRCDNVNTVVTNSEVTCGTCASYVAAGGACPSGQTCDPATSECRNGTCVAYAQQGASCQNAPCDPTLQCSATLTCEPLPTKGAACIANCASPYKCINQMCADPVQQGGACTPGQCASNLTCDPTSKTCLPYAQAALGQPCGVVQTQLVLCQSGLKCVKNTTGTGDTCAVAKNVGDACTVGNNECGTFLACVNGTCAVPDYSVCK